MSRRRTIGHPPRRGPARPAAALEPGDVADVAEPLGLVPVGEQDRLRALRELAVLDTPREERFDRVVRLARSLFDVPMVAVSLVDQDRQLVKASVGLGLVQGRVVRRSAR